MGRERREHTRFKFEVPVDIKSGHYLYVARTDDISEGGLFLRTPAPLAMGSTIHLHLKLDRFTVSVIGKVVWRHSDPTGEQLGVGVQFSDISPYARTVLRGYLRTHRPMAAADREHVFRVPPHGNLYP